MNARTALITGVSGQDGIYLARLLAAEGTRVVGTIRPEGIASPRIAAYLSGVTIVELDIRDDAGIAVVLDEHRPDEVFNLAAFTSVGRSWDAPETVAATNGAAVQGLLAAIARHRDLTGQDTHVFHASSAEVGAGADNPYALAKAAAEEAVIEFRERHGLHACFAKLHNHESPLRGAQFVTRKITQGVARIHAGGEAPLDLGNLDVHRDWGFAGDYVDAMRRMTRLDEPLDLELGTGVDHSLRDLVTAAFAAVHIDDPWAHVDTDPDLLRPSDIAFQVADPGPAQAAIGWTATVSFEETIAGMVAADIERLRSGVEEDANYLGTLPLICPP
jgi:GDPmannose 4,6-dehydratase